MPTPASYLFSPLPETALPPPHLISLKAGQGPSDPPLSYDRRTRHRASQAVLSMLWKHFTKKHNRSLCPADMASSSSRSSANGHDPHGPLRSQTVPVPQTPVIGTYTPSQLGPATYRSYTTPLVGSSRVLYPEQSSRSGPGSAQDARTYSTDTIRAGHQYRQTAPIPISPRPRIRRTVTLGGTDRRIPWSQVKQALYLGLSSRSESPSPCITSFLMVLWNMLPQFPTPRLPLRSSHIVTTLPRLMYSARNEIV
jgi:hypothetical protein